MKHQTSGNYLLILAELYLARLNPTIEEDTTSKKIQRVSVNVLTQSLVFFFYFFFEQHISS